MAFDIHWMVEGQVVHVQVYGEMTLEDVQAANDTYMGYIKQKREDVPFIHFIVDITRVSGHLPVKTMQETLTYTRQPGVGWSLLINKNRLLNFVSAILSQLPNVRHRSVSSLESALDFLQTQDATLPDLKALAATSEAVHEK